MKPVKKDWLNPINTQSEINACIEHVQKYWDFTNISFKDKTRTDNAYIVFMNECFNFGLEVGDSSFMDDKAFTHAHSMQADRSGYLTDVMGWDYKIACADSTIVFLNTIFNTQYIYKEAIEKEKKGFLNDYTDAVEHLIEKLNLIFDNIENLKPFNYEEYTSQHTGKDLIYGREDNIDDLMNEFDGHRFIVNSHLFPARIDIGNTSYMDIDQGINPSLSLIGAIYIQAKLTIEYNNSQEFMAEARALKLDAPLSIAPLFFEQDNGKESWLSFFNECFEKSDFFSFK
jgi:hypothetical protein